MTDVSYLRQSLSERLGPIQKEPYTGPAICTPNDPSGKDHTPAFQTYGRHYSELRANNQTPEQMAEGKRRAEYELMCNQNLANKALLCNRNILEVRSAKLSIEGGYGEVSLKTDGTNEGSSWEAKPSKSLKPKVKAGLCVALEGSPKPDVKSAKASVSAGYLQGSINNEGLCVGGQFPPSWGVSAGY